MSDETTWLAAPYVIVRNDPPHTLKLAVEVTIDQATNEVVAAIVTAEGTLSVKQGEAIRNWLGRRQAA